MGRNRQQLLDLIAMGRLSPAEAERLILAWNEGRETVWALAACVVVSLPAQLNLQHWLPALLLGMNALLVQSTSLAHQTVLLLNDVMGGIV